MRLWQIFVDMFVAQNFSDSPGVKLHKISNVCSATEISSGVADSLTLQVWLVLK